MEGECSELPLPCGRSQRRPPSDRPPGKWRRGRCDFGRRETEDVSEGVFKVGKGGGIRREKYEC